MSHVEHPITIGLIEHRADQCPAEFKEQADIVVPALRQAGDAGQVPDTLVFSPKDHGGVFVADGTTGEVESRLPELPIHEVTLKDATADETAHRHLHDPSELQQDESARQIFLEHAEARYFPGRFPSKDAAPAVPGHELADFIESKHQA